MINWIENTKENREKYSKFCEQNGWEPRKYLLLCENTIIIFKGVLVFEQQGMYPNTTRKDALFCECERFFAPEDFTHFAIASNFETLINLPNENHYD